MNLKMQKRLASDILKCGVNKVWMDPTALEEISEAVTRSDVRSLINSKLIRKKPKIGISSGRKKYRMAQKKKGRRKGQGRRKGRKGARTPKKEKWMKKIRALRSELRQLKENGKIERSVYRRYYRQAKGGQFHSRAHLLSHMETDGVLLMKEKKAKLTVKKTVKKIKKRRIIRRETKDGKERN